MDLIKNKNVGLFYLKAGSLLFWAGWFTLASLTNIFDLINAFGGLSPEWRFRSSNFMMLANAISIYETPTWIAYVMFVIDIAWQCLSAFLFIGASYYFIRRPHKAWSWVNYAFTVSIALWAMFLISEEFFIAYAFSEVHRSLFSCEILTLLVLHLLP